MLQNLCNVIAELSKSALRLRLKYALNFFPREAYGIPNPLVKVDTVKALVVILRAKFF